MQHEIEHFGLFEHYSIKMVFWILCEDFCRSFWQAGLVTLLQVQQKLMEESGFALEEQTLQHAKLNSGT